MAKMVLKDTVNLSTKKIFADSLCQLPICQTMEGGALVAGFMILVMMR